MQRLKIFKQIDIFVRLWLMFCVFACIRFQFKTFLKEFLKNLNGSSLRLIVLIIKDRKIFTLFIPGEVFLWFFLSFFQNFSEDFFLSFLSVCFFFLFDFSGILTFLKIYRDTFEFFKATYIFVSLWLFFYAFACVCLKCKTFFNEFLNNLNRLPVM